MNQKFRTEIVCENKGPGKIYVKAKILRCGFNGF